MGATAIFTKWAEVLTSAATERVKEAARVLEVAQDRGRAFTT